jgi:hypothetical protein
MAMGGIILCQSSLRDSCAPPACARGRAASGARPPARQSNLLIMARGYYVQGARCCARAWSPWPWRREERISPWPAHARGGSSSGRQDAKRSPELSNRAGAACSVGWSRCSHLGQLDYHDMNEMGLLDFMGGAAYRDLMGLCGLDDGLATYSLWKIGHGLCQIKKKESSNQKKKKKKKALLFSVAAAISQTRTAAGGPSRDVRVHFLRLNLLHPTDRCRPPASRHSNPYHLPFPFFFDGNLASFPHCRFPSSSPSFNLLSRACS